MSAHLEPDPYSFFPNFRETGTAEHLAKEFNLTFNGPGWYMTETDAMLIVPNERNLETVFHGKWKATETFTAYVYNGRNPRELMYKASMAPTRSEV